MILRAKVFTLSLILLLSTVCLGQETKLDSLRALLESAGKDTARVDLLNQLAEVTSNLETDKALEYATEAHDLAEELDFKNGHAKAQSLLGVTYYYRQNWDQALEYQFSALQEYEELQDRHGMAFCLQKIGVVQWMIQDYEKALEYTGKSLDLLENLEESKELFGDALSTYAVIYVQLEQYDKALEYLLRASELYTELELELSLAITQMGIGTVYLHKKQYEKALPFAMQGYQTFEDKEYTYYIAASLLQLAEIQKASENYQSAMEYALKSLFISKEANDRRHMLNSNALIYQLYADLGDFKEAFQYQAQHFALKDSLFNENKSQQIAEMQTKYDTGKKDQDLVLNQASLAKQRIILIAVGVLLLLFVVLAYIMYQYYRSKQKTNSLLQQHSEKLQETNSRLENQSKELLMYRFALDNGGEAVWWVEADTSKILYINNIAHERLGYTRAEMLQLHIPDIDIDISPEQWPHFVEKLKTGETIAFESRQKTKDGSAFPVEVTAKHIKYEENDRIVAFSKDITERKKAEEELRTQARAIEQSPATVVITDTDGNIEYVNPKFVKLTGYTADEVLGNSTKILKSGVQAPEVYAEMWSKISKGENWEGEFCNKKKNGELYWEYAFISPVRDEQGKITHFVAVKEDITERKQITEELKAAKEAADEANQAKGDFLAKMSHEIRTPMNAIIGMSHLALQTELNPKQEDYIFKANRAAHSLLGLINDILDFSKIEAGKMDVEEVDFHLEDVLDNLANMMAVKVQEKGLELLFSVDSDVPKSLIGDPLRLGQVLINVSNNALKFTENGQIKVSVVKESEDGDKVKLRFSIKDSGIGIPQEKIPNLFEEFTQAESSTTRKYGGTGLGLAICKKLSELMGGAIWAESEPGQGSTFIFTVVCGKQEEQAEHRYKPSLDLRGMNVLVVDDNSDAREIFQSYLENFSFKVTTAASGQEAIKELERNAQLENEKPYDLILMDWKMPGMDGIETSKNIKQRLGKEKSPKIVMLSAFGREELMQQAEQAGIDGFLIKPVNQSILFDTIMSVFGQESHVSSRKASKSADYTDQLRKIRGASILLAEDNEINQQVASELLENEQLMVSIVNNGKEAVEAVANWDYDVVLMDIQMPELNGYEATQEIKKNEQYKDLPIIAMTAHAMASEHEKCFDVGMVDVITKPIDPDQMFLTLIKWIKPGDRDTISEVEEEEPQVEVEVKLPAEIAGIDIPTGLTRVAGNKKLFRKLLLSFRESNVDTPEKIKEALEKGDMELAQRLAHTVKGVSGNFAADELYNAAGALEVAIKDEDTPEIDHLLAAFSEELSIIIQAISILERVDATEEETGSLQDDAEIDKAEVASLLEDLKALMEEDFSEAEGKLEKLKALLRHSKLRSDIDGLEKHIEAYDFDSATETIDHIKATLE